MNRANATRHNIHATECSRRAWLRPEHLRNTTFWASHTERCLACRPRTLREIVRFWLGGRR